jgi:hypothetical protein
VKKTRASSDGAAKRLANIEPHKFKPGQSGNPAGSKPGTILLSTRIKRILEGDEKLPPAIAATIKNAVGADKKALDAMLIVGLLNSLQGDDKWAKLLLEHGYGKAEQTTKLTGADGGPVHFTFTWEPPSEK